MSFKPIKSDCLKVRQTMFDFLKRKKHQQLQQSLKQFDSASKSQNKSMYQSSNEKRSYYDQIIQEPSTIPLFSNRKSSLGKTMTITPKKITFGDENQIEYRSARRPLVEMISSNKTFNRSQLNSVNQVQKSPKRQAIRKPSNSKSMIHSSTLQPFIKRKIEVSLDNISEKLKQILQTGKFAQEKNGQLSIALVNFVKDLSKDNTGLVEKKFGNLKYILSAINNALSKFSTPSFRNTLQLIQEFGDSLTKYFHQFESNITTNLRQNYQQKLEKTTNQKQQEISQLESQIIKLEREIQRLNKVVEKQQKGYESFIGEWEQKIRDLSEKNDNLRIEIVQKEQQHMEIIENLTKQLTQQKQKSSRLQKQLKNATHQHENYILSEQSKKSQQIYARQAFLLDQIETMKLTFNTDISELHKLYESKHLSYQQRLSELTQQLNEEKYKNKCDRQVSDKILAEANISRKDISILRKKNQELIQDLCKINDQFFKHWLALKDVKTLAQRLNVYRYFEGIYMDLTFDPLLFRA